MIREERSKFEAMDGFVVQVNMMDMKVSFQHSKAEGIRDDLF